MLPEAREKLPEYSELTLCVGFFLVFLVDEIVHFFYGAHDHNQIVGNRLSQHIHRGYGSGEARSLLSDPRVVDGEMRERCCGDAGNPRMCHVSHTPPCDQSSSGVIGLLCALFVHSVLEGLAIGLQGSASQVSIVTHF